MTKGTDKKMAKNSKTKNDAPEAQPAETGAPAAVKPQASWDDAQMRTSYANVCNVFGSREEITLLFGTNQAWRPGEKDAAVTLNDRIMMTPYTAKRLAMLLEKGLAEYEKRFGEIKI